MLLPYRDNCLFIDALHYELGGKRRSLEEMQAENLLAGPVEHLAAMGYRYNLGLAEDETLLNLATRAIPRTLERIEAPRALVFQHCNAENAVLPTDPDDKIGSSRNRYFPGVVLRELELDGLPYLCSFASGCAGFISLLMTAPGLFSHKEEQPVLCAMADCRAPGFPFDMLRERILGTDHSSAFAMMHEPRGYQVLGANFYSTTRTLVPLVEIVKRTVDMIRQLASSLDLDLASRETAIHYPNIFPDTWNMVTRYLRLPQLEPILDEMPERAHCGASDSVITLARHYRGQKGRLHFVVNYGVGLHLGVSVLEEQEHGTVGSHSSEFRPERGHVSNGT